MSGDEVREPDEHVPRAVFGQLTSEQARRYLDRFLTEQRDAVDQLRGAVSATGGPADALNLSVESLEPLWAWTIDRVAHRTGYTPPPRPGDPPVTPPATWDDLDEDGLPSWARHLAPRELAPLSDETWQLVDLVGRYVAEVLRSEVDGVTFETGDDPHVGYDLQNRPVLRSGGGGTEVDPFEPVVGLARRSLWGDDPRAVNAREPDALRRFVELRLQWLRSDAG